MGSSSQIQSVTGPELDARQLHDILKLRVNVFVVEQACPYPEIDDQDLLESTTHLWLQDDDGTRAYIRVLGCDTDQQWRIGRVVTRENARGEGLTRLLFTQALNHFGHVETVLDAQSYLHEYYASLGYVRNGDEFIEDGIPHIPMARPATTP